MSKKYIDNGVYATSGYTLSGVFQSITIGAAGTIGGPGLIGGTKEAYTIVNSGDLMGSTTAIYLRHGGTVVNSGTLMTTGRYGVAAVLKAGGVVINSGSAALIEGAGFGVEILSGRRTVMNQGIIDQLPRTGSSAAVYLNDGGVIVNSEANSRINGYAGVVFSDTVGTVINVGLIQGRSKAVYLKAGGTVTNTQANASIFGGSFGIEILGSAGTVGNAGNIEQTGTGSGSGVLLGSGGSIFNSSIISAGNTRSFGIYLSIGGTITNGSSGSIAGASGVVAKSGAATLVNYGRIFCRYDPPYPNGLLGYGVLLDGGGIITNGSLGLIQTPMGPDGGVGVAFNAGGTLDNAGIISASLGVFEKLNGGAVAVNNTGTIEGEGLGIDLSSGGIVNNIGTAALITGIQMYDLGTITNTGRIMSDRVDYAIHLGHAGNITSFGSVSNGVGAIIEGPVGIVLDGPGIIDNFGTIGATATTNPTAVKFQSSSDILIDEAGSSFIGQVIGGGGTLELAGAAGTITGLGTSFSGFGTVDVLTGSAWSFTGANTIATATSLTFDNGATVAVSGAVSGSGTLVLAGLETFSSTTRLTVSYLTVSAGTATLSANFLYAGSFIESGGTVALGGKLLTLSGAASFTGGTLFGAGHLFTKGATSVANIALGSGVFWNNYTTATVTGNLTLEGASRLSNESGAAFDITGDGGVALAAGGTGNIVNAGLFEKTGGTGLSIIGAAIANNGGTIEVRSGTLDLAGAVTYSGQETIGTSGTLKFDRTVGTGQTIAFAGTSGGALVLNDPSGSGLCFTGTVAGFGGSDTIDLASFAYVAGFTPSWVQSGAGGTLTVVEGTKTAKIKLFGQYAAGFSATKDAAGDTLITYTTPTQVAPIAAPHR